MTDVSNAVEEPSSFTTLPASEWPDGVIPDGLTYVTREELGFLREWSWGAAALRVTCERCSHVMIFERHPADWPNHPGEPGELRIAIECNRCGKQQYLDGRLEEDFVKELNAELMSEVKAEVARRMGISVEDIADVNAGDAGNGGDNAASSE